MTWEALVSNIHLWQAPDIPSAVEGLKSAGLLQGFLEDDRRSPAPAAASAASAAAGSAPGPSSAPAPPPASPPTALEALSRDDLSQRLGILSVVELRSLCNQLGLVRGVPPTREDYVDMLAGWVEGATNTLTQQVGYRNLPKDGKGLHRNQNMVCRASVLLC